MKLGVTGLLPRSIVDLDLAAIRLIRESGFSGTALSVSELPAEISTERAREIGRICASEGVEIVEYGHYQTSFVDPDPDIRAGHLETVREACRVANAVGCSVVIVGIGSHNPAGQWFPHADNYTEATRACLVSGLTEAAFIARESGLALALECHVATTLRDARTARAVIGAVDSPALKVHLDPVNWMTFETVYESGQAIATMFSVLGETRISGAHSKGVAVENRLISHLNEVHTSAPDDILDHAALLSGLSEMPGDPYLVIEHLTVEQMPAARAHLLDVAAMLGLRFSDLPAGGKR